MATPAGRAAAALARLESLTPDRRFVLGAVSGAVLCDYGESVGRALAAVFVGVAVLYGVTHSVVRVGPGPGGVESRHITTDAPDLAILGVLALTTSGSPVVTLQPRDPFANFLTGFQALFGISLTGLLGFVVGNRIRH